MDRVAYKKKFGHEPDLHTFSSSIINCLLYLRTEADMHGLKQTSSSLFSVIDVVATEVMHLEEEKVVPLEVTSKKSVSK